MILRIISTVVVQAIARIRVQRDGWAPADLVIDSFLTLAEVDELTAAGCR